MIQFKQFSTPLFLLFLISSCGVESEDVILDATNSDTTVEMDSMNNDEISELDTSDVQDVDEWLIEPKAKIDMFANAVLEDDIATVTTYIKFPLTRKSPLPPIMNKDEFKTYYPTLFDTELKENLQEYLENYDIIDRSGSNGTLGILNGAIWFWDSADKISSMNYTSQSEKEKQAELEQKLKNNMHPILKDYESNYFLGRTEDGLIRIDYTEKGLRYASWYGDQNMSDEPDFILWDGAMESQGSAGGWRTTFDKVDTQYILDEVAICAEIENCGVFLLIKDEGEITSKLEVTEILNPFDELD